MDHNRDGSNKKQLPLSPEPIFQMMTTAYWISIIVLRLKIGAEAINLS